jgi:hypothetical protein
VRTLATALLAALISRGLRLGQAGPVVLAGAEGDIANLRELCGFFLEIHSGMDALWVAALARTDLIVTHSVSAMDLDFGSIVLRFFCGRRVVIGRVERNKQELKR